VKTLGNGGTATVKLGIHNTKKQFFALKIIKKKFFEESFDHI